MIKVKVKPEDFIVEEVADLPLQKRRKISVSISSERGGGTLLTS